MLINESLWLKNAIKSLPLPQGAKVLNFGSQRLRSLRFQPYIQKNIYLSVAEKQWNMVNFDLVPGEGVDISGDIMDDEILRKVISYNFNALFLFNVLEHVVDIALIAHRIGLIVPANGYLLVSVPYHYPVHNDPIDNRFRPTPEELARYFPGFTVLRSEIVYDHTFLYYLTNNINVLVKFIFRLATPFYKYNNWKTQVAKLPYLFKKFSVTVLALQKVSK